MSDISWADTQKLVVAALQRSGADRERFLRDNCADPALSKSITGLLARAASPHAQQQPPSLDDTAPALATGAHVGPYVIIRRLGRGGMGEVFLARDPRLDRPVALKCLLASTDAEADLRERIAREARAAARITHPNVAAVHDIIEHQGRAFIVMEYVEGESLGSIIQRGPLPPARALEISRQLAAALIAAHGGGIIHRDLKPANVHVAPDGSVKILDFGIAVAFASLTTGTTRTAVGIVTEVPGIQVGTPAYMSPEQLLGRTVDERSDLFSLALIIFEMVTGRRPVRSGAPLDLLVAAIRVLPRADSVSDAVPAALADVIEKALAADPDDRYQSAAEMLSALDTVKGALFPSTHITTQVPPRTSAWRRVAWVAGIAASLPLVFWVLGKLTSEAYNVSLERTGAFAADPARLYVELGRRSVIAPIVYATLAAGLLWLGKFVVRIVDLSEGAHRGLTRFTRRLRRISTRLSLDQPIVLTQGLATVGLIALGLFAWRFNALISAWGATISTADPSRLLPLSPENEDEKVLYRAVLTVLFLVFTAGLLRVLQLRRRLATRGGAGALVALVALVVVFLALNEIPYRIMWQNKAPRVEYGGQRCYIIGEAGVRRLLYCPDNPAPRNRQVDANDPALKHTGVVEEIFTLPVHAR